MINIPMNEFYIYLHLGWFICTSFAKVATRPKGFFELKFPSALDSTCLRSSTVVFPKP